MSTDPTIAKIGITHPSAADALSEYAKKTGKALDSVTGSWVGTEKKRYDFVLKYLSGHSTSRGYAVHNFVDKSGARFLAFLDAETLSVSDGTEGAYRELRNGDCFTCKATVNRHSINTYKHGTQEPYKETVLNRMKFHAYLGKAKAPYEQKLDAL